MRVLVVGRGARGRVWEALVAQRRDVALAGTVDPDGSVSATWQELGDAALASADAAIIASPPPLHAEQARTCLAARLRVLVEKPLALSVADAEAVNDAARIAGQPVLVGQNFAHRGLERAVDGALAELGPLRSGTIVSARSPAALPAHATGLEHPVLWDFGVHHFDLIRRRAGGPPTQVAASCHGTSFAVSFTWNSGLEVGWRHDDGGPLFHRSEWWRAEGGAVEVQGEKAWRVVEGARPRRLRHPRGDAETRLLDALVRGVSDAAANVSTVAMVAATAEALDTGRRIDLRAHAEVA